MKQIKYLVSAILVFGITTLSFAQKIDAEKSIVNFEIPNMGGMNTVKGTFKGMKGVINFNIEDLAHSSFDVCISPATIKTGIDKRDKHLKSEDFFEVEKYPTICYKSKEIKKTTSGYETEGELTLHGVTKTIKIDFTESVENGFVVFKGKIVVNRFDYKLASESYSSTFTVGELATIEIICYAKK